MVVRKVLLGSQEIASVTVYINENISPIRSTSFVAKNKIRNCWYFKVLGIIDPTHATIAFATTKWQCLFLPLKKKCGECFCYKEILIVKTAYCYCSSMRELEVLHHSRTAFWGKYFRSSWINMILLRNPENLSEFSAV